jgi:hypothetical protein
MSLLYSRVTPFGFIDPATATDEDLFYGEEVSVPNEAAVLKKAEALRTLFAQSGSIQTRGFDSQSQAVEMAEMLVPAPDMTVVSHG